MGHPVKPEKLEERNQLNLEMQAQMEAAAEAAAEAGETNDTDDADNVDETPATVATESVESETTGDDELNTTMAEAMRAAGGSGEPEVVQDQAAVDAILISNDVSPMDAEGSESEGVRTHVMDESDAEVESAATEASEADGTVQITETTEGSMGGLKDQT